ncbi:Oxidoreductase [Paramarasmius palmivorus]|uniref:Mitochondrial intermembrane space import and assembly protein 40 n=1 Tax=Paramarasmius palmivorus TaxID=297713 RepID=A0AAW0DQI9_9AGAR
MFAQLRRLPLRRCLHTQVSQSARTRTFNTRYGATIGASVAVASYLTWRITHGQHIALDSETSLETPKKALSLDGPSSNPPKAPPPKKKPESLRSEPESSTSTTTSATQEGSSPPESEKTEGQEQSAESEGTSGGGGGGAFNPVTGEINWDCPCLGGMAYGPCGEEFREAFSCFVYSEEEPKGINCVDKFQAMQTCFRAHPEVYKDEIMDDEEESQAQPESTDSNPAADSPKESSTSSADQKSPSSHAESSQKDTPATQA